MAATIQAENKALSRRLFEEVINGKDYDVLEEIYASDIVGHGSPALAEELTGRDAHEAYIRGGLEAIPDLTATIEAMVAEDDLVAFRLSYTGTNEGDFMDIPATGEKVSFDVMGFHRIEDGKIAETWSLPDTLDMMQQLGAVEGPGE